MHPIALSTMWLRDRFSSLDAFFDAAQAIGFDLFELNHFITLDMVRQTRLPAGQIHAVHAPCPTQPFSEKAQVSALDKEERTLAVEATKASIDLASQIGARAVILHPGQSVINPHLEAEMRRLYDQGRQNSRPYQDLKSELAELRARHVEPYLDATRWSLERLAGYADAAGVRLGLENRYSYHEIPLPHEMDVLLREFAGPVGFWFDVGHAYVLEALGFVDHTEWLAFQDQLVGIHLHDVKVVAQETGDEEPAASGAGDRLLDHQIPGTGIIDYTEFLPPRDDSVLLTCELSWEFSPEQIEAGRDYLLQYLE